MKQLLIFLLLTLCYELKAQEGKDIITVSLKPVRKALVIGNQKYLHFNPLLNIYNDADDMKIALEKLGFIVTMVQDVDNKSMNRVIVEFTAQILPNEFAFFYFSGHGLGYNGKNYLLPININPRCMDDLDKQAIMLDSVLLGFEQRKASLKLAFVDACRSKPNLKACDQQGKSHIDVPEEVLSGGFVKPMNPPKGTFIAFATQEGKIALERKKERNSLFTSELLRFLTNPTLSIRTILDSTTIYVEEKSNKRQIPSRYDELRGDFWFAGLQKPLNNPIDIRENMRDLTFKDSTLDVFDYFKCEKNKDFFSAKSIGEGLSEATAQSNAQDQVLKSIGLSIQTNVKRIMADYIDQKLSNISREQRARKIEILTNTFDVTINDFDVCCQKTIQTKNEYGQEVFKCILCGKAPKELNKIDKKELKKKLKSTEISRDLDSNDLVKFLFRELEK